MEEVDGEGRCCIEQKNKFSVGETIEIMKPNGQNLAALVKGIFDEKGNSRESAPHPREKLWIDLDQETGIYDILRRREP